MRTAMIGAHAVGHLLSAEQAGRLDDGALAMHPLGLNRVEPGTLDRQVADQDAHALALLLDLRLCARIQARTALLTCQEALSQISAQTGTPSAASLGQHQSRNWMVIALTGRPATKRSQTASACPARRSKQAVAGQGFGIGIVFGDRLFDQAQRLVRSAQACRWGWASRLHHTSSAKPSAQSGCAAASAIRRSRRLFFGRTPDRGW